MTLAPHDARTAGDLQAVAPDVERRAARWLLREARLLDEERYDDWLDLLAPDIHYWVPGLEVRHRADERGPFGAGRMAFFDDDLASLRRRVARFTAPSAWSEDPPTRHIHLVSNIEVDPAGADGALLVRSVISNVRGMGRLDTHVLHGRREDLLRPDGDGFRLARRLVVLAHSVLAAKNLNTFL